MAKSLDLEILGEEIREQVKKKYNINLDWELIRIGKFKKFKKIVILGGGISDEKEISDLTSKEVYNTLKNKYDVSLIDVTQNCEKLITNLLSFKPDVVFNCLHGFFGEDGQVQSILNYLKIKYTHSGVMTSSVLMNKEISKKFFSSMGVKSPSFDKFR